AAPPRPRRRPPRAGERGGPRPLRAARPDVDRRGGPRRRPRRRPRHRRPVPFPRPPHDHGRRGGDGVGGHGGLPPGRDAPWPADGAGGGGGAGGVVGHGDVQPAGAASGASGRVRVRRLHGVVAGVRADGFVPVHEGGRDHGTRGGGGPRGVGGGGGRGVRRRARVGRGISGRGRRGGRAGGGFAVPEPVA